MMERWQFGTKADGQAVTAHRLVSNAGFKAVILDQGAILQSFTLHTGQNVTLGFEDWERYERDSNYVGRIIGPNANRIENARFAINGQQTILAANDGNHNLHGGPRGFDAQRWSVSETTSGLTLGLKSPDGHTGFPGNVEARLQISLIENILRLEMRAFADRPTPMNLTWHPYWNLGQNERIDDHNLRIDAENHAKLGVTGMIPVKDSRLDFRKNLPLGSVRLDASYEDVKTTQLTVGQISMTVTSSLPGMQVYTGDALPNPRAGIAIEPQFRPNDINLAQDSLLRPGEVYRHWIEYKFDET